MATDALSMTEAASEASATSIFDPLIPGTQTEQPLEPRHSAALWFVR
jgi:hypothetical protein